LAHVALDGGFGDVDVQLEQFTSNPFGTPGAISGSHFADQRDRFVRYLRLGRRCRSRFPAPEQAKALAMPAQHGLGLDDQQRLTPEANPTGQDDEERPINRGAARASDAALEYEELLAQQRILSDECGLAAHEIGKCSHDEDRGGWLCCGYEASIERVRESSTKTGDALTEVGQHGKYSLVDGERHEGAVALRCSSVAPLLPLASTRRCRDRAAIGSSAYLLERMSQTASTAVSAHREDHKIIEHPAVGPITVDCDVLTDGDAELKIVILTVAPDTEDETKLRLAFLSGVPDPARA